MEPEPATPTVEELLSHAAWIRAFARRLVADDADADDLAQEALAAAARRPPPRDRSGAS